MEGDLIPELIAGSFQDLFRISSGSLQDLFGIFSGLFSRISSRIDCIQKDCLSGPISGSFQDFFSWIFFFWIPSRIGCIQDWFQDELQDFLFGGGVL